MFIVNYFCIVIASELWKYLIIINTVASFEALRNIFLKDKVSVTPNTCGCLPAPHKQGLLHVTNNGLLAQLKAIEKESLTPSFLCENKTFINVYRNSKPVASSIAVGRETVNLYERATESNTAMLLGVYFTI